MPLSPQSDVGSGRPPCLPTALAAGRDARRHRNAFTLIELIFVLALLPIGAMFIAANVSGFFRGRALNFEARRMLSLANYGHTRAVAEGVPVVLWIDAKNSAYGLTILSSFTATEGDPRQTRYTLEPSLSVETPAVSDAPVSELDDEKLGLPENVVAIRFNPDGFIDESSVQKITLKLTGTDAALALVPRPNRLSYEIIEEKIN